MNLTRNLCLFFLCGVYAPAVYAAGSIMKEAVTLQAVNQNTDETKLNELQEFRKKYKLANPKASENELKSTQMAVKMLMLQRTGDYAVTGADLWGEKVTNQHLRDVAKTVRVLSYGALKTVSQVKQIWIYIWIICLHITFSFECLSWYIVTIVMYERFLLI